MCRRQLSTWMLSGWDLSQHMNGQLVNMAESLKAGMRQENLKNACSWWRHQMETFSALLAICAGNSPVNGEFSAQRPVTRSFDVLFDLRLNKWLSKQSRGWWFETPSRPLWSYSNVMFTIVSSTPIAGQPSTITILSANVYILYVSQNMFDHVNIRVHCKRFLLICLAFIYKLLTHWSLVTPFGDIDLGQHWLR